MIRIFFQNYVYLHLKWCLSFFKMMFYLWTGSGGSALPDEVEQQRAGDYPLPLSITTININKIKIITITTIIIIITIIICHHLPLPPSTRSKLLPLPFTIIIISISITITIIINNNIITIVSIIITNHSKISNISDIDRSVRKPLRSRGQLRCLIKLNQIIVILIILLQYFHHQHHLVLSFLSPGAPRQSWTRVSWDQVRDSLHSSFYEW